MKHKKHSCPNYIEIDDVNEHGFFYSGALKVLKVHLIQYAIHWAASHSNHACSQATLIISNLKKMSMSFEHMNYILSK